MTTPRSFDVIFKEMVSNLETYYGLLFITTIYGLFLAESGELSKAEERIQAFFDDPDYFDQLKDILPRESLSKEELKMLLEKRLPDKVYVIHGQFKVHQRDAEDEDSPSSTRREILKFLRYPGFVQ